MKKLFFLTFSVLFIAFSVEAQKYAIIDTRYILDKMPEYAQAQKQLPPLSSLKRS